MERTGTLTSNQEVFETANKYLANHYHRLPVNFTAAYGNWLFDEVGQKWVLDMVAQYSALGFGRGFNRKLGNSHIIPFPPENGSPNVFLFNNVRDAVKQEWELGCGMLPGSCPNRVVTNCAKSLCEFTGMDKVVFMNTGAEAFDTAVKIIRKYARTKHWITEGNGIILVCSNNFHGRTLGAISASDVEQYREGFGPLLPGFGLVRFGDIERLEKSFELATLQLRRVIAFLAEPIQGEGGVSVPPNGYLRRAREICRSRDALFVLDEVQTGFGRTGNKFAWEHDGPETKPDLIMLGKMMCGGAFVGSAVGGSDDIMGVLRPGDHGSTFGGIPLACAAVSKVVEIFNSHPELISHVKEAGEYFLEKLREITRSSNNAFFKEVRGRGLLIGVEFTKPVAPFFRDKLLEEGILAGVAGHDHVLRFSPPLIITKEEIDWALPKIRKALR